MIHNTLHVSATTDIWLLMASQWWMEIVTARDSNLVQYQCQRREHQRRDARASRVFVYRGSWAYCEAGKRAPGHEFLVTDGLSRRQLEDDRSAGRRPPG